MPKYFRSFTSRLNEKAIRKGTNLFMWFYPIFYPFTVFNASFAIFCCYSCLNEDYRNSLLGAHESGTTPACPDSMKN